MSRNYNQPVYLSRTDRLKYGLFNIAIGLLAWQANPFVGRVFVFIGLAMLVSAAVTKRKRIA